MNTAETVIHRCDELLAAGRLDQDGRFGRFGRHISRPGGDRGG